MSELNKEIGDRIKGIRALSGLSADEFAQKIATTSEQLLKYENGEVEIPVSFLHDLSIGFDISMTELLTGESAKLSMYSVVRKGKGVGISRRQEYDYQSLAYNFANRTIDPFFITIQPKPSHNKANKVSHSGQEFHYVLDGTVRISIGKHEVTLRQGDSIYFDSTFPHCIEALENKPAQMLITISGKE